MHLPILLATCALGLPAVTARAAAPALDDAFVGSWRGTAEIVVNWTTQRTLPVALEIASGGSVTGQVGDAVIVGGEFRRNRGFIGRALHLATDYIITGRLEGPVIANEGIDRDTFTMPLNWRDGVFIGGIHAGHSKFGGRDHMMLSATRLRLVRDSAKAQIEEHPEDAATNDPNHKS